MSPRSPPKANRFSRTKAAAAPAPDAECAAGTGAALDIVADARTHPLLRNAL